MNKQIASLITAILLLPFLAVTTFAQDDSPSKRINKIKREGTYIYAEATAQTEQEALDAASALLLIEVSEYVASKKNLSKAEQIIIKDLQAERQVITMPRGEMTRAFLYVKKRDVEPVQNIAVVVTQEELKEAASLPIPEETIPEEVNPPSSMPVSVVVEDAALSDWQRTLIEDIAKQNSLQKFKMALNRYKAQYKVKRIGENNQACPTPQSAFYAVFNARDELVALLGHENKGSRRDYLNGKSSTLSEYGSARHVWFVLSK